jgi:hypothetical protein
MLHKLRIALAVTVLALAAVSAVDSASARFGMVAPDDATVEAELASSADRYRELLSTLP